MEWLLPHITRINNFCNTLEYGQNSYLQISRNLQYEDTEHDINVEQTYSRPRSVSQMELQKEEEERREAEYQEKEKKTVGVDDNDADYPPNNNIDFQGQVKRYNEIMKAKSKTFPVSVIVSDRTNSTTSSAPSPTSSVSDSSDWYGRQGGDDEQGKENCRGKTYMYKPAPMVKKSERRFISAEQKDTIYWERRKRNNAAARKSRESRREKEIEVNRHCDQLKQENNGMKFTIMNLQERNSQLESSLKLYKEILIKNNLL